MIVLWIIGGLMVLIGAFVVYRLLAIRRARIEQHELRNQRLEPILVKIRTGVQIHAEDVVPLAYDIRSRCATYEFLEVSGKLSLFPQELITFEKAAEGRLANWLEFPTELDTVPDAIEHMERVTVLFDGHDVYYHVFKYMTKEPHWAAKDGWMLGVVGPYFAHSSPYDLPSATFSRCDSKLGGITPKDEAQWVHEHIALRR
jgi:hypothetical protein